ncbi:hypothetical protein [Rhodococcus qingshengii]|uniref:hypothetical protein n=1 Tax=Rhodococcus qingshengii TaxID=334542 RepID=UPI0035D71B8D
MNWWQQMPWIVAACALMIGPFIAGAAALLFRRLESRDRRAHLMADAELLAKFPEAEATEIFQRSLEARYTAYVEDKVRAPSEDRRYQLIVRITSAAMAVGMAIFGIYQVVMWAIGRPSFEAGLRFGMLFISMGTVFAIGMWVYTRD